MFDLRYLCDNQLDALHEALRVVVMKDVHVYTLIAASKERLAVLISLDAAPYCC